jgi:hypothetical protein
MYTAQTSESSGGHTNALEVRQLNFPIVANHHVLNVTLAIDEHANLPSCFVRKLTQLSGKLRRDDFVWRYPARIEFFYTSQLVRLEAQSIA